MPSWWTATPDALTLLCSETNPENQLYVRWRRFTLRKTAPAPEPLPGTEPPEPSDDPFQLLPDEAFNLQHREFDLTSRKRRASLCAGGAGHPSHPGQHHGGLRRLPAVFRPRGSSEVPMCAALPAAVRIQGLDPKDVIGIHTYCRDDHLEIIDARYLAKVKTNS